MKLAPAVAPQPCAQVQYVKHGLFARRGPKLMSSTLLRLTREDTALLVVDVQPRLLSEMFEAERVLRHCTFLAAMARHLGLPTILTEQNPEKLGTTVPALAAAMEPILTVPKMLFSACTGQTLRALRDSGRRTVL